MLEGEPAPCASEPGLDLVEHEEDSVLITHAPHRGEVADRRDHDACLTLDCLEEDGGDRR